MAEVFGAAVSGIGLLQLSTELFDGAVRLKTFYERARDAPSMLKDLAFELETISLLLQRLEQYRQQDSHDAALMERCISACREKAKSVQTQIDKLEERLQKHDKLGRGSVAFKIKELHLLRDEMERWKTSIMVAFL